MECSPLSFGELSECLTSNKRKRGSISVRIQLSRQTDDLGFSNLFLSFFRKAGRGRTDGTPAAGVWEYFQLESIKMSSRNKQIKSSTFFFHFSLPMTFISAISLTYVQHLSFSTLTLLYSNLGSLREKTRSHGVPHSHPAWYTIHYRTHQGIAMAP